MRAHASTYVSAILLTLLTLLPACGLRRGAATAEEAGLRAALEVERQTPWQHIAAEVHGTRQTPWGTLVLYTRDNPDAAPPMFPLQMGFVMTAQHENTWKRNGALWQTDVVPRPDRLVEYRMLPIPLVNAQNTIVIGQAFAPEVARIEATFDTGQTLHDELTGNMFALIAPNAVAACTVRVLDAQGTVLQEIDPIREQPAFTEQEQQQQQAACPS